MCLVKEATSKLADIGMSSLGGVNWAKVPTGRIVLKRSAKKLRGTPAEKVRLNVNLDRPLKRLSARG